MINTKKLFKNNRSMMLACDQGLEHGPSADFNEKNIDPNYILDIALESKYTAVILQNGVAQKYYHGHYKDVPLVVKLNGKTSIPKIEPISKQVCSVERAVRLGASAVGYTVYLGSPKEPEIFQEFGTVVEQAHNYGIPVIAWMYPRGPFVKNDLDSALLAHAARAGLELGADFVKMKYNGDFEGFKWAVKSAGRTKILAAGGSKVTETEFLKTTNDILRAGAAGIAVGRNVWQSKFPFSLSNALHKMVLDHKPVDEVLNDFKSKKE